MAFESLKEEQKNIQRERKHHAIDLLSNAGYDCYFETDAEIRFWYRGHSVSFYPLKQWASGKTIRDCRGIRNLLKQLT
jgi:hypothetical protein